MKVTRKETIKVFEDMKKGIYPYDPNVYLDIAINSLEIDERYELEYENAEEIHREKEQAYMQGYEDACKKYRKEPCEDAISRQAVLDATVKRNSIWNKITNSKGENLEEIILQLPPVIPQPKMGHWKVVSDGYGDNAFICECSECKDTVWIYKDADRKWNYCPNCGAKMQEIENE